MDHLQSFIADCDRRTEVSKKRLAETQEEISAEVAAKVRILVISLVQSMLVFVCFILFLLLLFEMPFCLGCSGAHFVDQTSFKLIETCLLLPLPPKCWDYKV